MYPNLSVNTVRCDIEDFFDTIMTDPKVESILTNGLDHLYSRQVGEEMQIFLIFNTDTFWTMLSMSAYSKLKKAIAQGITIEEVGAMLNLPK
ncbi:uncharacterized protein Dvar_40870 [Desulfosarcina variabilis str. Montpellier]|uniref:hypothetical protein n=1 Tax=Desulfosarcina variabilis TaxID=2300 RepID=UPI003AFB797A